MRFIKEKLQQSCCTLKAHINVKEIPIDKIKYIQVPYKTSNVPPCESDDWKSYDVPHVDAGAPDSHFWFKLSIDVPKTRDGREYRFCGKVSANANAQCTVFVDSSTATCAFDPNHSELAVSEGHHDVFVYYYTGTVSSIADVIFSLALVDTLTEQAYYDLFVPTSALEVLNPNSMQYAEAIKVLDKACLRYDFRDYYSNDYYDGIEKATEYLKTEYYEKLCASDSLCGTVAYVGHSHVDVAWLWTVAQTREKIQRTFSTALSLMERYPDYKFMFSQPQLYEFVKNDDPELFEKIKQRVAEGRWEVDGAMWLEPDTNLPSGESLIRQIIYGKRFIKEEFGKDSRILWLPDVFGYSAALPQILKKSGVDYFFTTKLAWSETNRFPHDNFLWQGIDGSEVLAFMTESNDNRCNIADTKSAIDNHREKRYTDTQLAFFGFGDGGGGPTACDMEHYRRMKDGLPGMPKVRLAPIGESVAEIEKQFYKNCDELCDTPRWEGELYLEFHRGTYTTVGKNKRNNRKCELAYQKAEALCVMRDLLTNTDKYPSKLFFDNEKNILLNQFHDIIPGSSIGEVYDVTDKEYAKLLADADNVNHEALSDIASRINTNGGILVYNPNGFDASGTVEIDGKRIFAESIPSHGWAVLPEEYLNGGVSASERVLENEQLRIEFDEKYHIVSLYDKSLSREVIPKGQKANVLEVYEDIPKSYDAWEISDYHTQKCHIVDDLLSVESFNDSGCAGFKLCSKYGKSEIIQTIRLEKNSRRVDFETVVDWHEDHVLLKAAFPVDIRSDRANYEIQFGHVSRPTHKNNSWDEAMFEVCAHKWADLSEYGYGVSLMNDCKYGHSIHDGVMRISLLKAPKHPWPFADMGKNVFTYSIYPHGGSLANGGTIQQAALLNQPLCAKKLDSQKGSLPESFCLVHSSYDGFITETVKKAENGDEIIFRGYEAYNGKASVHLDFGFDVKKVFVTDLLENELCELDVKHNGVDFNVTNFEIVTLKVVV